MKGRREKEKEEEKEKEGKEDTIRINSAVFFLMPKIHPAFFPALCSRKIDLVTYIYSSTLQCLACTRSKELRKERCDS